MSETDPLAGAFAVQTQELLLLLSVDAGQGSSSGDTVLVCCFPALLLGPFHVVEELHESVVNQSCPQQRRTVYEV